MRELDGKSLITGDFVLVTGDVVTNMVLGPALKEHRARRAKDKNAIMTMVLRQGAVAHRSMDRGDKAIFVVDKATSRCLHYERLPPHATKPYLDIPPEVLADSAEMDIRTDLLDCAIDICSPDVPALFTENFDYGHIRGNFVHGILNDHELYGKTIYCHIVEKAYVARVRSLQTYDAVSRDIVSRWVYPMCIDHNLYGDHDYTYYRTSIYKESGVQLARSSEVQRGSVIGAETTIGENTVVKETILGRRCKVGDDVVLEGAYIWDDVTIGSGSSIGKAIIASGVVIGNNVKILPGAIISHNVKIADGQTVYGNLALTNYTDKDGQTKHDPHGVGTTGLGHIYDESESDSDELDRIHASQLVRPSSSLSDSSDYSVASSVSSLHTSPYARRRPSPGPSEPGDDGPEFFRDAHSYLLHGMQSSYPVEAVALELTSLRMSANAGFDVVRRATSTALVNYAVQVAQNKPPAQSIPGIIHPWKVLFTRMVFSEADQVDLLLELQRASVGQEQGGGIFFAAMKALYEVDIASEEAILKWSVDGRGTGGEMASVRGTADKFVTWLKEAEEESDDEDEEESDDE